MRALLANYFQDPQNSDIVWTLILGWDTKDVRELCVSSEHAETRLGYTVAESLKLAVSYLRDAGSAGELMGLGVLRVCGPRVAAMELADGWRVLVEANQKLRDGDDAEDWSNVARVKILAIKVSHGD
jgi:hypothetical protein